MFLFIYPTFAIRGDESRTEVLELAVDEGSDDGTVKERSQHQIKINGMPLENVEEFKYLGSVKSNDGTCSKDLKIRIAMAKQKTVQLNNIWKDKGIPKELKIKILKCLIWLVVTYGCEAWTLKKAE